MRCESAGVGFTAKRIFGAARPRVPYRSRPAALRPARPRNVRRSFISSPWTEPSLRANAEKLSASGGAGGIRTLDTVLPYTHFPGERLRPLGHRSAIRWKGAHVGKRGK